MKITTKFRDTEHLRFEDTKKIMLPEKFRVFRERGAWFPYGRNCRERIEMADVKQCITVLFHLCNTHLHSA